jgi:oligopeptide/dipeptide ABC transporter ATP-binding protein
MYAGRVAEKADVGKLFENPMHPYTSGLIDSIPKFEYKRKTRLKSIEGMVPSITDYTEGCRFRNRCDFAFEPCHIKHPGEFEAEPSHKVYCYRYGG